ncbi:EAL domain-containing protein [Alteromonas facilis]|uniref:EAL domain-containing protein n=1 Tax=Alteromonas facilis TaxID=2048004 RepID=UPI000C28E582|nr:EAL domain-containing protein [Alteromonas facilis]
MWCPDCENIEEYYFDETEFWIFFPTEDAYSKVVKMCGDCGYTTHSESSHCLRTCLSSEQIEKFLIQLTGCLAPPSLAKSKIITVPKGEIPKPRDFGRVLPADVFVHRHKSGWIMNAIEQKHYESWFQPIVYADSSIADPTVFAHEALFRVFDDNANMMPPSLVFSMAHSSELLYSVDLIARRSAVECAARAGLPGKIFINFNPSSVYDPAYCLRSTASAITEIGYKPSDIVFEITETHRVTDMAHLKGILAFYRHAGFGVALDDIGSGWSGLNMLKDVRPDYVKIDMELVQHIDSDPLKQSIVEHLIQIARNNGIKVIAEGVEREEERALLQRMGADYLQGYLFAKPARLVDRVSSEQKTKIKDSMRPLEQTVKRT